MPVLSGGHARGAVLGQPKTKTIIRRPSIKIEVDRWDWQKGSYKDTLDLTKAVMNYTWQKTIKSPSGGATITILPQNKYRHFLDDINVLDVVRIYEFDTLKWQGYVRRVASAGYIDGSGKPNRSVSFQCTSFGGYLLESIVSVNMEILRNNLGFMQSAEDLANHLAQSAEDPLPYNSMVNKLIEAWFGFISDTIKSTVQEDYIFRYVDFTAAMSSGESPGYPREVFLFSGEEDEINLWSIIEKLAEVPMNEFFFDEGPRSVHINGINQELTGKMTYLIGRPTPFDGTVLVNNGIIGPEQKRFQAMPVVTIPQQYLIRYDLNKTMEDVFSLYLTAPLAYDMSALELLADGREVIDDLAYKKYLYRLCNKPLYYINLMNRDKDGKAPTAGKAFDRAQAVSQTLYNWYRYNDLYLSGTLTYMVPSESREDPRIGDKVAVEGFDGNFYMEGVQHSWNYQGPLKAVGTITRGWSDRGPIELKNKVFRRPTAAFWEIDTPREVRESGI